MRHLIGLCILLVTFQSNLFAKGGKKPLEDNSSTKTVPLKTSTIFSQTIEEALPDLCQGNYLSAHIILSKLQGPFDPCQMNRDELADYGNFIFARAMCQAALFPTIKTPDLAQHFASDLLVAAEVLHEIGDPKFFIVKYCLQEQTLKERLMRWILYPTQLQGNFSVFLDEPQKARLKALIERVRKKDEEKRLKAKL